MPLSTAYLWSKAPAIRLLISLIVGIVLQWQFQSSFSFLLTLFVACFAFIVIYFFLPLKVKFRFAVVNGILISLLMAVVGAGLVLMNDVRNHHQWIGHNYKDSNYVVVTLQEPLVGKPNSFKALATIENVYWNDKFQSAEGQVILYFKKDSSVKQLRYGSQIIFNKPLQEIKNAGNPG